jgi:hypothetical protein
MAQVGPRAFDAAGPLGGVRCRVPELVRMPAVGGPPLGGQPLQRSLSAAGSLGEILRSSAGMSKADSQPRTIASGSCWSYSAPRAFACRSCDRVAMRGD